MNDVQNAQDISSVAVIGAGNMGHQIAVLCALNGLSATCCDPDQSARAKAADFAATYLAGRVEKGRITADRADAALARLGFTDDLAGAVSATDFVIEAATEKLDVKRAIFADLDRLAPPHAILATNSSTIVSSRIADATARPERVLNMHFFNPALVMKLVEVVQGPHVSDAVADTTMALCLRLGKHPVRLRREVEGFLLNRILMAISREAQWLLEMGVADIEDIDMACIHGAGHPMGPFRMNDLTGLDLAYQVALERFRASGDRADLPMPSLTQRVAQGRLGRKTGAGWYDYET